YFDKAYAYVKKAIEHHKDLLREQIGIGTFGRVPAAVRRDRSTMSLHERTWGSDDATPHDFTNYIERMAESIEDIADRMAFGEYYDEINEIIGDPFDPFPKQNVTKEEAERVENFAYNIIVGSQARSEER